jgi:hypothetical protein
MKLQQAPQREAELRGIPDLLTQLVRPRVGALHFWGRKALYSHKRRPKGTLQRELLLRALGSSREGLEQGQSL